MQLLNFISVSVMRSETSAKSWLIQIGSRTFHTPGKKSLTHTRNFALNCAKIHYLFRSFMHLLGSNAMRCCHSHHFFLLYRDLHATSTCMRWRLLSPPYEWFKSLQLGGSNDHHGFLLAQRPFMHPSVELFRNDRDLPPAPAYDHKSFVLSITMQDLSSGFEEMQRGGGINSNSE